MISFCLLRRACVLGWTVTSLRYRFHRLFWFWYGYDDFMVGFICRLYYRIILMGSLNYIVTVINLRTRDVYDETTVAEFRHFCDSFYYWCCIIFLFCYLRLLLLIFVRGLLRSSYLTSTLLARFYIIKVVLSTFLTLILVLGHWGIHRLYLLLVPIRSYAS
jgi:hypothetical protein